MSTLAAQIAALPGWQRARVDRVRVDGSGGVAVTWMGMVPLVEPTATTGDLPDGVGVTGWAKPEPLILRLAPGADPEGELGVLAESGILGDVTVERVTAPDEVRWRAQAWTGHDGRALLVDGSAAMLEVLAADADRRLATWRLKQAEAEVRRRVRDALEAGESAPRVAIALGVSRARVYQLRDGRR